MNDPASQAIESALHQLGEHYEAVQILATRTVEGDTHTACRGVGNWHARVGLAHEFLNAELAQEQATQISERLNKQEPGE